MRTSVLIDCGRVSAVSGAALTIWMVIFHAGCERPVASGTTRDLPSPVTVEIAERRDVPLIVELPAHLEASSRVEIRAFVEGRLLEMSFTEGKFIKNGQMLFRIDRRRYDAAVQSAAAAVERAEAEVDMAEEQQRAANAQSALRQAEANLLRANQDLERLKPLAARKAVPARDLDSATAAQSSALAAVEDARSTVRTTMVADRVHLRQAKASLLAARAALDTANLDLAQTEISAPMAGLISEADVSVGNYVGRGEASRLATLSKIDPIRVMFAISETLYLRTVNSVQSTALDRLDLILADGRVYPFQGRFANLAGAIDDKSNAFLAVAQFRNPEALLLPGMTGRVRFTAGNRNGAVVVPEQALFDSDGAKSVKIISREKRVEIRRVSTEGSYQGKAIVIAGLAGGECVIVAGGSNLRAGDPAPPRR